MVGQVTCLISAESFAENFWKDIDEVMALIKSSRFLQKEFIKSSHY